MMTIGDIRAAIGVARTLRDDWQFQQTEAAIAKIADEYTHEDILYAIVVIARDPNNRAPMMIGVKAPDIIARLHAKVAGPRTPGPSRRDKTWLCSICGMRRDVCESSAANRGEDRHEFIAIRDAEANLPSGHRKLELPALKEVE